MTRARIINSLGNVEEVSDREMFRRAFGHYPRTPEQKQAEYDAEVERYIKLIESGGGWSIPPAYRAECERIIAEREAERADLEPKKRPDGRWEIAA